MANPTDKSSLTRRASRRDVIAEIMAGAFVTRAIRSLSLLGWHRFWANSAKAQDVDASLTGERSLGDQLRHELARLDKRDYSQEGIPMFLACENLDVERRPATPLATNAAIAADFRRLADTLLDVRDDVTESDVAKIVELLADRDFMAGGIKER